MLWRWASSTNGQAAATWLSAILSLIAILIALTVALVEQRRANAEKEREAIRQREEHEARLKTAAESKGRFIDLCINLTSEAIAILEKEIVRIKEEGHYVSWTVENGVPHLIIPIQMSLKALQSIWQDDAQLVLTLSRSVRTLDELVFASSLGPAPSAERAVDFSKERLADLVRRRTQFEDCRPI